MPKKFIVKESGLFKFLQSYFSFKKKGNDAESSWLKSLRKVNPELADIWEKTDWEQLKSLLLYRKFAGKDKGPMDKIIIDAGYAKNSKEIEQLANAMNIK